MSGQAGQADALPAELAELEHVAAAADSQISGAVEIPGAPAPPERDIGGELGAMMQMAVTMLAPVMPFLPGCYPVATCDQIGTAFAAVADKRGWNLDAIATPELALAVVALPPTIQAIVIGKAYFAEQRQRAGRPAGDAGQPGQVDQAADVQSAAALAA